MDESHPTPDQRPDPIQTFLILLALALALTGLILLQSTPLNDKVVIPTAAWIAAAGAITFILALLYRPLPRFEKLTTRLASKQSLAWVIFSLFLATLAAGASYQFRKYALSNFIPVVSIWLLGAVCYVLAFLPAKLTINWKTWFAQHHRELLALGGIFLLAAVLRFYQLGEQPRVMDGDEGRIGMYVLTTERDGLSNPFALWENMGALYMQGMNVAIDLFGQTPFALRLLPAIAGTLAVISIFLLGRQVAGTQVGLISAFILAITHTHIHFSRTAAVSYIQGTWLIPLEMYFFLSGIEKRSTWRAAIGGVVLAIHMVIYLSAQIMLGVFAAYCVIAFIALKDQFRPAWRQALAFWGGFLITFIPEGFYMFRHPNEFMSRFSAEGTFSSGWLGKEIILTGKSTAQILLERVVHAFLSLIYYPAIDFYGSSVPMLSLLSASLLMIGLAYALVKTRTLKFLLMNGYFWGATVAIGVFAIPPSADTYRMLVALPAAIILIANAIDQLLRKFGLGWQQKPYRYAFLVSMILVSLTAYNLWTYYFDFLGKCRFGGDTQTRFASYLGNYVRGIEKESDIYLLSNDVYRYGSHDSVNFLIGSCLIINHPDSMEALNPVSGETIIASPDRIEELRAWAHAHPGGDLHIQYDCERPMLLAYQIP